MRRWWLSKAGWWLTAIRPCFAGRIASACITRARRTARGQAWLAYGAAAALPLRWRRKAGPCPPDRGFRGRRVVRFALFLHPGSFQCDTAPCRGQLRNGRGTQRVRVFPRVFVAFVFPPGIRQGKARKPRPRLLRLNASFSCFFHCSPAGFFRVQKNRAFSPRRPVPSRDNPERKCGFFFGSIALQRRIGPSRLAPAFAKTP